MKSKSDVYTFALSIGLTLDKGDYLNNLKVTIYNYLKKTKEHYYKNKLDKINLRLFTYVIIVQLLMSVRPFIKFWK